MALAALSLPIPAVCQASPGLLRSARGPAVTEADISKKKSEKDKFEPGEEIGTVRRHRVGRCDKILTPKPAGCFGWLLQSRSVVFGWLLEPPW